MTGITIFLIKTAVYLLLLGVLWYLKKEEKEEGKKGEKKEGKDKVRKIQNQ